MRSAISIRRGRIAATAVLAAAGAASAVVPAASASAATASPAAPASASAVQAASAPSTVWMTVQFAANGVNIHSSPSTSASVRGLGYEGQSFSVTGFDGDSWLYGRDNSTGVWGWVLSRYTKP